MFVKSLQPIIYIFILLSMATCSGTGQAGSGESGIVTAEIPAGETDTENGEASPAATAGEGEVPEKQAKDYQPGGIKQTITELLEGITADTGNLEQYVSDPIFICPGLNGCYSDSFMGPCGDYRVVQDDGKETVFQARELRGEDRIKFLTSASVKDLLTMVSMGIPRKAFDEELRVLHSISPYKADETGIVVMQFLNFYLLFKIQDGKIAYISKIDLYTIHSHSRYREKEEPGPTGLIKVYFIINEIPVTECIAEEVLFAYINTINEVVKARFRDRDGPGWYLSLFLIFEADSKVAMKPGAYPVQHKGAMKAVYDELKDLPAPRAGQGQVILQLFFKINNGLEF